MSLYHSIACTSFRSRMGKVSSYQFLELPGERFFLMLLREPPFSGAAQSTYKF
jgi:hypothetical protein